VKKVIRSVILIVVVFFGVISIKTTYDQHPIRFLDDWMGSIAFYFLIALGIIAFLIEQHYYFTSKKLKEFGVTAVAAFFCILISLPLIRREVTDNATLLFEVSGHSNTIRRFEFKNNERFRLIEGQGMSSVLYYGTFSKKGDTIKILESNYDNTTKLPGSGIIRHDTMFWNN